MQYRTVVVLFFVSIFALVLGCGVQGPKLAVVEGKVLADDKPLERGSVAFHPDEKKNNTSKKVAAADIGPGGSYKLYTDGKPGAPLGWYKVTVVSTSEPDSAKPEAVKSFVASHFNDPKTTPLSIEVTASPAPGAYDLKVSAK